MSRAAARLAPVPAVVVLVALAATTGLAGCGGPGAVVDRLVVCAGPTAEHPTGSPAVISLRQGGREVASASTSYGALVALLVPSAPTAVFVDGRPAGTASFGGEDATADPASLPAPDDTVIATARATDPATVDGYIGLTGLGCPPTTALGLG
ncbi:hypothetical protein FHN55_07925 [Streptomyces sp. NP160]|uniref:hypothetical protein n=1 Tax=Streptomyces sp. NP160 TaxID=2586637 RepID=UPI00111B23F6|nr:hypothetical protein [Streptomyces sp. NP160]TNM68212.1 hypothetical protein FHN55_07925 [Streptomyces sp. NP160]